MTNFIELDSYTKEENPTIIIGRNILLKIIEDPNKQALLKSNLVKKFVSASNLSSDDTRNLIHRLMEQEMYMTTPSLVRSLLQNKDKLAELSNLATFVEQIMSPLMKTELFKTVQEEQALGDSYAKKMLENKRLLPDLAFRIKGKVNRKLLKEYEKKLLAIDKEIQKKIGHGLLVPSTLFLCPKCNVVLDAREIDNKKCVCCNSNIDQQNMRRISFYKVHDEIKAIWRSNLWFEAYFANLLRKLEFRTWTSVQAMGASGILHEVDVLAIRDGTVVICECKTGKVSRNDVFNFHTKVGDLKSHLSILALIGELPERQTREFVKKNPAMIRLENMGKLDEKDVLKDLANRLSLKA
jgi:hypothetical protein